MHDNRTCFRAGLRDGIPIALGYFAVAFTLGIAARNAGFTALQAFVESLTNNASAGEYAVFSLVAAGAGLWEVAIMTLVANARYLLMSCSLSQKLSPDTPLRHRMLIAFDVTDEIFGISVARPGKLNPWYTYGAMAVAIHDIGGMTTEELAELANSLVRELLISRISVIPDEAWTDFYEYSEDYYDINSYNVPTPIQNVGFLETYYYDFGVAYNTHEYDLRAYVQEIFNQTEEEFRAAYAAYPIVISKMEEVVRVLQSYGVRIYE